MDGPLAKHFKAHRKRYLALIPVLLGVLIFVLATKTRSLPKQVHPGETAVKVRVVTVVQVTLVPRTIGYGNVTPGMVWEAVAEVGGRIEEIHPKLKKGAILAKGEVLLRIDPSQYQLASAQAQANIRATEAGLAELDVKKKNTRASLKIEERGLELGRKELDRKRSLLKRKAVSQAAADQEEQNLLITRQAVQSLRNTLNLIPVERLSLEAELALNKARLETAKLDLERTTITAPFDLRIAEINVERTQYAGQGKKLVVADSIDVSEVSAQIPIDRLINLMPVTESLPSGIETFENRLPDLLGLLAVVRLRSGDFMVEWKARFSRISDTIDPKTRTVGVIVSVDDPYRQAVPGIRPPLAKNMFVEVELQGRPRPGQIVIPRAALHDNGVFVIGKDNRLEKRSVGIAFVQSDFAVVAKGLKAGERIVVSDMSLAVNGMLLDPVADKDTARVLLNDAEGRGPVR